MLLHTSILIQSSPRTKHTQNVRQITRREATQFVDKRHEDYQIHVEAHAHEETKGVERQISGAFTDRRFEVKDCFVECFTE
jgi:hypothetical protein